MIKVNYMDYDLVTVLRTDLFRRMFQLHQKYFEKDGNDPESLADRLSEDVLHTTKKNIEIPLHTPVHLLSIVGGMAMPVGACCALM